MPKWLGCRKQMYVYQGVRLNRKTQSNSIELFSIYKKLRSLSKNYEKEFSFIVA